MTSTEGQVTPSRKRRTLGDQLNRSPRVVHASWTSGLAVLLSGVTLTGFTGPGVLFLVVLFLPIVIGYRRDRLSFVIVFGTLFLPTWPLAMYLACSRKPRRGPEPSATTSAITAAS